MATIALCAIGAAFAHADVAAVEDRFDVIEWDEIKSSWSGEEDAWAIQPHLTQTALTSTKTGSVISRSLPKGDGPLRVSVIYAFKTGRIGGAGEIALEDAAKRRVVIRFAQLRDEKYVIEAVDAAGKATPLATLADKTRDLGVASGGDLAGVRLALRIGADGKATLSRLGGESVSFTMPPNFSPTKISFVDQSQSGEQLRIVQLRAFRGETDPSADTQPLILPLGASFTEGAAPDVKIAAHWMSDEERDAKVTLKLARVLPDEVELSSIERSVRLKPSQPGMVDAGDWNNLTPGLYTLSGSIEIGAAKRDVTGRFAVLAKELANRPGQRIPEWIGMMPYLNLLPQNRYADAFALMERIGVRHVRWLPGWGRLEETKDQYDWRESDYFVDLCDKHHMKAMFCLSYFGAPWTIPATNGEQARSEEGRTMWVERFAVPTIKRYGDRVKQWQIWNEPDAFWNDDPKKAKGFAANFATPANYFDMLKRTHEAAHAMNIPDLKVMASLSSADQPGNLKRLFEMGLADIFDGIIVHTYGNHVQHLLRDKKFLAAKGFPHAPIGSGEIGIPTASTLSAERNQAALVAKVMLSSTTVPDLMCVDWFVLTDIAHPMFGLLDQQLHPQSGVLAYHTMARLLSGATRGTMQEKGDIRIYRVERESLPPLVAVSVSQPTSVRFKNASSAAPVMWNLWGNASKPEMVDDRFSLTVEDVAFIEGDVAVDSMLIASVQPAMENGKPAIRVAPEGEFAPGAKVTLAIKVPELNFSKEKAFDSVAELRSASIALPETQAGQSYACEIELKIGEQMLSRTTSIEFTPVMHVNAEQAKSLRLPRDATKISIAGDKFFQSLGHGRYFGPDDNSAQLSFGWSDKELILWVEQTDDIHAPVQMPNPWGFDGPQWAISTAGGGATSGASFIEITFGIGKDNKPFAAVVGQPHYDPVLEAQREGTTTRYRVSIPFSQLGIEPAEGKAIATTLIVNDNDGDGRKGWIGWGAGVGEEKNPAKYRTIILDDSASVAATASGKN